MKKLVMMLMIVATVIAAKAATVDWKYNGEAAEDGYTVYLFTTAIDDHYDTFADLTAGTVGDALVAAKTVKGKTSYTTGTITTGGLDTSFYAVVVSGADATEYSYGVVDATGYLYNPAAQESSPGPITLPAFTNKGTIGSNPPPGPTPVDTPEPTSGLLLLVGGAALALRRKQK